MNVVLHVALLLLVPILVGYLAVNLALGRMVAAGTLWGKLPLALGLGLGLTGSATFVSLVLVDHVNLGFELGLLLVLVWWASRRVDASRFSLPRERWLPASRLLLAPAVLLIGSSAVLFVVQAVKMRHGGWDAWDFWNMRARAFARGGEDWTHTFSQIPWWTHPEYPVLLPSTVARGFKVLDAEAHLVPITIAWVFTFATVALVWFGVSVARGRSQGLIAAAVLAATPYFVFHGTQQYADNPLGFFFLATMVCLSLYDHRPSAGPLILGGLFAALAAFTKNEGILFFVCVVVARSWVVHRRHGRAEWRTQAWWFSVGAAPVLALVLLFKTHYAVMPDNAEFYASRWEHWDRSFVDHVLANLKDTARYRGFVASWWHNALNFDEWRLPLFAVLAAYGLVQGVEPGTPRAAIWTVLLTVGLQLLGISAVFLWWSTYDIVEHMDATNRLLMQMLPMLLFVFFRSVRAPFRVVLDQPKEDPA